MVSLSSNCCRVDAVKASANQLKSQYFQVKPAKGGEPSSQIVSEKLQSLDAQIKAGDANKAEVALLSARAAVQQLLYSQSGSRMDISVQPSDATARVDVHA